MANIFLLSILFLVIFLVLAAFKRPKRLQHRPIPSPPRWPIIGNLHQLGELQHQSLWNLSKKYGPVMLLKLGKVPTVILSSSETARQALRDNDLNCCSRPPLAGARELSYNNKDMSFSPYNDYWKELRKLCARELFSAKQIHSFQPIKDEEIKKVIAQISESASLKHPVNLSKTFLALTVSVVCKAAFGVSFEGTVLSNDRFNKLVRDAFETLGSFSATDFIPHVGWIIDQFTGLQKMREKSVRDLDAFYEQLFDLKMVIKETWRLHPPTPLLLPREVTSEFEIGGYTIPVKTRLHVNVWAIGRDPDTWKDPEMFYPERFMDNNIDAKGQNFELLSFGSGRRICPGMYMGTTMVEFGLASLLYHFDWELPEGMVVEDVDMEEAPGLTVSKKSELLLVPVKYLNQ